MEGRFEDLEGFKRAGRDTAVPSIKNRRPNKKLYNDIVYHTIYNKKVVLFEHFFFTLIPDLSHFPWS